MGDKRGIPGAGVHVAADIYGTYRQVSRGKVPAGDAGRGGSYDHRLGQSEPVIRTTTIDGCPCAWVQKGTGDVMVVVQLYLVRAGGQGIPGTRTDRAGVVRTHYEYWIAPEAVPIVNGHENDHRRAIERQYERTIAPMLERIESYREPRLMKLPPGRTEADCRRQLESHINWKSTISQYQEACAERDRILDREVGTRFGTMHEPRDVTDTESTDHLVVPYPVPTRWLARPRHGQ